MTSLNSHENYCLENADHFTAVRGRTARDRTKSTFNTMQGAEQFAASFGDGRTMIYAVSTNGNAAHVKKSVAMKGYIFSEQKSLFGQADVVGFGDDGFSVKEIDRKIASNVIIENHYSKKVYAASYIHLGVFIDGTRRGVLQFGYAMNPASGGSVVAGTEMNEYLELNRMWLDDVAPRNSESKAISYSIKFIKRKFPKVKWIQSFADERCGGFGIVYQACSFDYFGEHTSTFWELDGVVYHNSLMTRDRSLSKSAAIIQDGKDRATSYCLRQFRYIKFLDKREKKNCTLKQVDYPKHYNEEPK